MGHRGKVLSSLLLSLLLFLTHPLAAALPNVFYGDVSDPQGNLIYREVHTVSRTGEKITGIRTEIFDLHDKLQITLQSDFHTSTYLPNFQSERSEDGFIARAIKEENKISLLKKEKSWDKYLAKTLTVTPDMVVGHGYYFYLIDHLPQLLQGHEELSISILIPHRLEQIHFSMAAEEDPEDPLTAIVTLVPKNPFHKLVIPKITLRIHTANGWLVSYEGPNTFLDMKKIIPSITIKYHE